MSATCDRLLGWVSGSELTCDRELGHDDAHSVLLMAWDGTPPDYERRIRELEGALRHLVADIDVHLHGGRAPDYQRHVAAARAALGEKPR